MSNLKKIIVELENCVHDDEQYSGGIPVVWSREFQKKISQNTNHWNDVQRKKSHVGDMDFQDEEDDNIRIPYDQNDVQRRKSRSQEEEEREWDSGYNYEGPQRDDDEQFKGEFKVNDYESKHKRCTYGDAHRKHTGQEEEETKAKTGFSTNGMRSERSDDCDDCYGTGMDFPRLKGDCPACGGSGKSTKEEQAEEDPRKAANAGASLPQEQQGREENPDEQDPENVAVDDQYGLDDPNDDEDFGEEEVDGQQEWDDPDYQGVIRAVPNSHLVYKRQNEDGTFDELWQYNLGDDFKKELKVRRAILAGTDIPINKMRSPDNSQNYELWTVGNGQMLKVRGLPN